MDSVLLQQLRAGYLNAIKAGSGRQADTVVTNALDVGVTAAQIYEQIFQPACYAVGHLWQENLFSVAQEHLATAIIERQMGDLHPYFHRQHDRRRTLVVGCVDGELHRVGARMVADFFEQDGWTVYYLGATVPTESFISLAREMQADLIGLASQLIYRFPTVIDFVHRLDDQGLGGLPVMVGGQAFVQQPDVWPSLGVHFGTGSARDAVRWASHLWLN